MLVVPYCEAMKTTNNAAANVHTLTIAREFGRSGVTFPADYRVTIAGNVATINVRLSREKTFGRFAVHQALKNGNFGFEFTVNQARDYMRNLMIDARESGAVAMWR